MKDARSASSTPPERGRRATTEVRPAALRIVGLSAWYRSRQVLRDVHLEVPPGSVTAIMGSADAGKSTLLRAINRLAELEPGFRLEGCACIDSDDTTSLDPTRLRRTVGMVFERPAAFPRSVTDNVAFGLGLAGIRGREQARRVEAALRRVGLWDELDDSAIPADRLDAGQRQRLCMARALALHPRALLFDEPTRWLHPADAARVERVIASFRGEITCLISVTDASQAGRVADRVALLDAGRVVEHGPVEDVFTNPRQAETEAYLSRKFAPRSRG